MDNPLNWFMLAVLCVAAGGAIEAWRADREALMVSEEIPLPAHPNAGVVDGDCIGQPDGTWKCAVIYHSESKPSPDIWKAISVCARNEITKEQELVCID